MSQNGFAPLKIAVGSDCAGYAYKTALKAELEKNPGVSEVLDLGVGDAEDDTAYPLVGIRAGETIIAGDVGIFLS